MTLRRLLLVAALAMLSPVVGSGQIVGGQGVTETSMTRAEVNLIFTLRRQRWDSGQPIQVIIYPAQTPQADDLAYSVLGMSGFSYEESLTRTLYLGRSSPPLRVRTSNEMLRLLQDYPYSIGYVNDALFYNHGTGLVLIHMQP